VTRIEIDLNVRGPEGRTRAALRHIQGSIAVGERVLVFEPDEKVETMATVAAISTDGRFAYLDVEWDLLHEAVGLLDTVTSTYSAPAVASATPSNDVWAILRGLGLEPSLALGA
jgi:hypothetical protein